MSVLDSWAEVIAKGDWMMFVLIAISLSLWGALGYRATLLVRGSRKPLLELLGSPPVWKPNQGPFRGFVVEAVAAAVHVRDQFPPPWSRRIDSHFQPLTDQMRTLRGLVATLIGLAPMAGLLGTVSGMMVLFESLGSSSFSSQTSGIANGISQALFTTEAALVIAVPCLVVGQILNRKEDAMRRELEQIKKIVLGGQP